MIDEPMTREPDRSIPVKMKNVASLADEVLAVVCNLSDRLDQFVSPDVSNKVAEDPGNRPTSNLCIHAQNLEEIGDTISKAIGKVNNMLDRLEV